MAFRLFIGRRSTGIEIRPHRRYAHMWRVCWQDGQVSPMGNLARAKEAALVFARQQSGFGGRQVHRWECKGIAPEASPAAALQLAG
jgi:hypothetical protein